MYVFSSQVGALVKERYGEDDGADLCFNLIESGVIRMADGVEHAALQVAMHLLQA